MNPTNRILLVSAVASLIAAIAQLIAALRPPL